MSDYPEKEKLDYAHDTTKAALNLIPVVGGALASVFETVFSSPIDKRKEEWLVRLAETVDDLCERVDGLTPEKLSEDSEFVSVYLQASNIAIRTHHEEKLKALNAAVKNTVLRKDIDESKKLIFLRIIDQMTPFHFKVFHFLTYPEKYIQSLNDKLPANTHTHWGDLRNVWDETFTDVKSSNKLIDVVLNDLFGWGFIGSANFHQLSMNSAATILGKEFIQFIDGGI